MGLSQENGEGKGRNGSKSIIRLTNDLQAWMGYQGNHMKCTRDWLVNEMTVNDLKQGTRGW